MIVKKEEAIVSCDRCHGKIIRKWNRRFQTWSSINDVSYWTERQESSKVNQPIKKESSKYRWLCRPCLLLWYEKEREEFCRLVPKEKRQIFFRYRYDGTFSKSDVQ